MMTELCLSTADIKLTHVPYKGDGPVMTDLIGRKIDVTFGNVLALLPHIRAGKLRALAVPGDERSSTMPAVSTVKETGYPDRSEERRVGKECVMPCRYRWSAFNKHK